MKTHGRYAYSPITQRPDFRWPNGAGLAVYFCIGVEEYSYGEGMVEDLLPGAPRPDLTNTSWRDYGNRVGGFRLLDWLADASIRPTLLLNTACYDTAPALVDHARSCNAEFVAHGFANSDTLATMGDAEQAGYIAKVVRRIAEEEGAPPAGWSSPWLAHSPATIDLLKEAGFDYILDLQMDDQPVWLTTRTQPLLCVPYALELNDSSTVIGRCASADEFATMILDQFDEMAEQAKRQPLVMPVVLHSFISGQPFRLRALRRALQHIKSRSEAAWFTTPGEIARHYRGNVAVFATTDADKTTC